MRGLKRKLASRRGASITFALLIFLVCAVVSSVVIVAGTAAAGRMSQIAQMDQRYYAVNSAAELVRDVLESQTVTVTTGSEETVTRHSDGSADTPVSSNAITPVIAVNGDEVSLNLPLIADAAIYLTAERTGLSAPTFPKTLTLTSAGVEGVDTSGLRVTANVQLASDGTLTIWLFNTDSTKGKYSLQLVMKVDSSDSTDTRVESDAPELSVDADGQIIAGEYDTKVKTTTTVTTTFHWKSAGISLLTTTG